MQKAELLSELVAVRCFAGSWDPSYQKEIAFECWMHIHDGDNVYEDRYVDADQLINGSSQTLALKPHVSARAGLSFNHRGRILEN
jgi:hypothetical protein